MLVGGRISTRVENSYSTSHQIIYMCVLHRFDYYFSLISISAIGLYFSQYTSIQNFIIKAIIDAAIIFIPIPKFTKQEITALLM
jgi:uncharacterized membrane protein